MEYCPRCMRPLTAGVQVCPHCGAGVHEQNRSGVLPVGTLLVGSTGTRTYRLGLALGTGGFGITYIAVELETGRRVAVKEFFPVQCKWVQRGADGVTVETLPGMEAVYNKGRISFLKEARVLASLKESHPTVVVGLDYVEMHNTAYLVMEYLEGRPLYQVVRERGGLSPEELLPKIDRLMDGVIWLHRQGIIHRDICPDNIMWMSDGTLKLLDFGAARTTDNGGQLTVHYKPGYAPVEQYTSGGQGPWTDVYTLAATICYALTGRNPVESTERLLRMDETGADPLQLPGCLDDRQRAALAHALALRKEDRTESVAQFRRELAEPEKPVEPVGPAGPASKRRDRIAAIIAVAAAALLLVVIAAVILIGEAWGTPAMDTGAAGEAVYAGAVLPAGEFPEAGS